MLQKPENLLLRKHRLVRFDAADDLGQGHFVESYLVQAVAQLVAQIISVRCIQPIFLALVLGPFDGNAEQFKLGARNGLHPEYRFQRIQAAPMQRWRRQNGHRFGPDQLVAFRLQLAHVEGGRQIQRIDAIVGRQILHQKPGAVRHEVVDLVLFGQVQYCADIRVGYVHLVFVERLDELLERAERGVRHLDAVARVPVGAEHGRKHGTHDGQQLLVHANDFQLVVVVDEAKLEVGRLQRKQLGDHGREGVQPRRCVV